MLARAVAQHLQTEWGQPVLVEMRPGGGTVLGSAVVAHAPADGHTLLFASNSLAIQTQLSTHLPYDASHAFEPVALMATSPQVLAVSAASPNADFKSWRERVLAQPQSVTVGSLGPATTQHLAIEMLQQAASVSLNYVPFAGGMPAVNAALGGHVDSVMANLAELAPLLESGRMRGLAITSPQRVASHPQLPTVAESGCSGFEAEAWFGVAAPAHTPRAVLAALSAGVVRAVQDPALRQHLLDHHLQPRPQNAEQFALHLKTSARRYAQLIESRGLKLG